MTKTAIKERPILFNGEMVRAILDGHKTQTRRVIRPQPVFWPTGDGLPDAWSWSHPSATKINSKHCGEHFNTDEIGLDGFKELLAKCSPYGVPGDRLWVRETWIPSLDGPRQIETGEEIYGVAYRADSGYQFPLPEAERLWKGEADRWRPSIHMPRWASRIDLEITDVRVERVQEITPTDCEAEGITGQSKASPVRGQPYEEYSNGDGLVYTEPRIAFLRFWDDSIAKPGEKWDDNPWVWAYEFKVIKEADDGS